MGLAEEGVMLLSRYYCVDKLETEFDKFYIDNERVQEDMSKILYFSTESYRQNTRYKDLGELDYLLDYIKRYRFESNVIGQLIDIYNHIRTGGDLLKYYTIDNTSYPTENREQFTHLTQYKLGKYIIGLFQKTPSELREYLTTTKQIDNEPLPGYDFIPNGGRYGGFWERNLSPQDNSITAIMNDIF